MIKKFRPCILLFGHRLKMCQTRISSFHCNGNVTARCIQFAYGISHPSVECEKLRVQRVHAVKGFNHAWLLSLLCGLFYGMIANFISLASGMVHRGNDMN